MAKQRAVDLVSAQVVVKPEAIRLAEPIMEAFREAGFEAGPLVGNSFSIAGPASAFEKYFDLRLAIESASAVQSVRIEGQSGPELPLAALPAPISGKVQTVLFTRPPDFGPGASY